MNPVVGDQLVLRLVDRLSLDAIPVLNGLGHIGRKRGSKTSPLGIFENLGAVLGHNPLDLDVKDLSSFVADLGVLSFRECAPIDRQVFDPIGIFRLLEGGPNSALLATGFFGLPLLGLLPGGKTIGRWRLAAVAA